MATAPDTAPGVYIEESASLSLSVQSAATAVPVFIGSFNRKKTASSNNSDKCITLASWLDFTEHFEERTVIKVVLKEVTEEWLKAEVEKATKKPKDAPAPVAAQNQRTQPVAPAAEDKEKQAAKKRLENDGTTDFNGKTALISRRKVYVIKEDSQLSNITFDYGALALQHYFINGGTSCYLLQLSNKEELPKLSQEIQKYPDISLLVCPQSEKDLQDTAKIDKAEVYRKLNGLLNNNLGYFLLADSEDGKTKPETESAQTAVYYPMLVTTLKPARPADTEISLVLESKDEKPANGGGEANNEQKPAIKTLHDLAEKNFEVFYRGVNEYIDQALRDKKIILPPSAAVAGAYATTDRERGVWKAPANVSLKAVDRVAEAVTDSQQGDLNAQGINVMRTFNGQGTLIWGVRTLNANSNLWKYVPVRRLFNAAERDIKQAMRFAMFEPNSQPTWERVRAAIDNYLHAIWKQGGLMGNTEKEAYFVQVGKGITMTESNIDQGRMIVKIGMAAVRPAEFIILKFTQNMA